jgi:hypothetical protein
VVLTDKIKSIYTIHHRMPKYRLDYVNYDDAVIYLKYLNLI